MELAPSTPHAAPAPRWRALDRLERRVAGVLIEKAKTTPDAYPLTVNSLVNGCNQKSNRFPLMQLDDGQVTDALETLRHSGAIALIQGDGRAEKYRHLMYDWLGVDKAELAVMAELLLRGAQTVGELRGRAARMEPIHDIGQLTPIVDSLKHKGLLIFLSPPGRGAVVTHNLYQPQELAKVKAELGGENSAPGAAEGPTRASATERTPPPAGERQPATSAMIQNASAREAPHSAAANIGEELASLRRELRERMDDMNESVALLRREVDELKSQLGV